MGRSDAAQLLIMYRGRMLVIVKVHMLFKYVETLQIDLFYSLKLFSN